MILNATARILDTLQQASPKRYVTMRGVTEESKTMVDRFSMRRTADTMLAPAIYNERPIWRAYVPIRKPTDTEYKPLITMA